MKKIERFRGKFFFLSNFYEEEFEYKGIRFKTVEAAFQGEKADDIKVLKSFAKMSPKDAKKMGKKLMLRPDWEKIKEKIMEDIVFAKFSQNKHLVEMLIETGNAEIIEGNDFGDTCWGVCQGVGENKLGKILMKVRENLGEQ